MNAFSFSVMPFGENGWLATLKGGDMVDRALAANAAADVLRNTTGVLDAVAGIDSIALRFHPADTAPKQAKQQLETALLHQSRTAVTDPETIEIPVCYGGEHGPDLEALCQKLSLTEEQVISLHSDQIYRVLTVGFAPGFAYLGPLPEALQTGRLATPRTKVPAGSVGVAGPMTGIYALASPGGWPLIGRTPANLFDVRNENPFLFSPGAKVCFRPIAEKTFTDLAANT